MIKDPLNRLLRAGLLTAVVDGTFSAVLVAFFYGSTVSRVFQGVASTLLGKGALDGGMRATLIGIAMHVGVAFGWSTVFLVLAMRSRAVRLQLASPSGVIMTAAIFGPSIWVVMSIGVIPALRHVPPVINLRWWIQFIGHFPFVGLPMVSSIASGVTRDAEVGAAEIVAA